MRAALLVCAALLAVACGLRRAEGDFMPSQPAQAAGATRGESYDQEASRKGKRDIIQVRGTKGALEMHEIRARVAERLVAFNNCYLDRLKQHRFLRGDLLLEILVEPTGDVGSALVVEGDVGDWLVERCVLEEARRMRFKSPRGGNSQAVFTMPLHFASDQPAIDTLPGEVTAAAAAKRVADIDTCARGGSQAPSEVTVTLYIGERGAVQAAGFSSAHVTPIHDSWAECAAKVVAAWTFPDPKGKIVKAAFGYRPRKR
jgi:hypothetical protein